MAEEKQKKEIVKKKIAAKPAKSGSESKAKSSEAAGEIKGGKIAVIRIKGTVRISAQVSDTMDMLRLYKKHTCVVLEPTREIMGMVDKIKDWITWGEIDDATLALLNEKRGQEGKKFFRLSPPKGGFERKGIKVSFNSGGTLGYRGAKINDLLKKMI